MKMHSDRHAWFAPALYMLLAMALWAAIEMIAGGFTQHFTSFQIVWMRYSVHLLFMLIFFGPRVKLRLVRTQRLGLQFVRGLLMMGMHLCFIFAVRYIPVNTTMAGFWISPFLLIGLSALLGEKSNWVQWGITLLGFAAVLVILRPLNGLLSPASLLSLGMVGFIGIYGFDKAVETAPTWVSAPFALVQPIIFTGLNFILRGINPGRLSLAASGLVLACFGFLLWRTSPLRLKSGINNV